MMVPADAESGFGFLIENGELDRSGLTIEDWVLERSTVNLRQTNGLQCMRASASAADHLLPHRKVMA